MKRNVSVWLSGMFFAALLITVSAAQSAGAPSGTSDSLGDYARALRKDKPAAQTPRAFDNDNLPTGDQLSVVGPAATAASDAETAPTTTPDANAATPSASNKPPVTAQELQQLNDDWKGKFSAQQDQINLLNRELTVAQKESQLRAAAMYADAGNRLRDSAEWDKQDAQYKADIAEKQKALDDAKQKLDDMQEQARKAGVSPSVRDVQADTK
jgi:hypothetical protein